MDLLTRSREAPDQAGQLLLGDRQLELVGVAGQLQQPLGRPAGHVQEHRVGQGRVGRSAAAGPAG